MTGSSASASPLPVFGALRIAASKLVFGKALKFDAEFSASAVALLNQGGLRDFGSRADPRPLRKCRNCGSFSLISCSAACSSRC